MTKRRSMAPRASLLNEAVRRIKGFRPDRIRNLSVAYIAVFLVTLHFFLKSSTNNDTDVAPGAISTVLKSGLATLILEFKRPAESLSDSDLVLVGNHQAKVVIQSKSCKYPRFCIRLVGDALVPMELVQGSKPDGQTWSGSFFIQSEGKYSVDARWYGCEEGDTSWSSLNVPIEIRAVGSLSAAMGRYEESVLFADSAWISKERFATKEGEALPDYIWTDPRATAALETGDLIKLENPKLGIRTAISKRGTLKAPHGMYKFDENGNYEIVCFWGGPSMWNIWQLFLMERPSLANGQRPFKFHYYNTTNLVHPDSTWPLSNKERSRKCKHIFLSVDEMDEPVSQAGYELQLTNFVGHLVKMLNDPTFPIWILTTSEPPMMASSCHSPEAPRSTDHPCNDVIKRLFRPGKERFPSQVHLMDNTDLVLPQFDQNRDSVLANIAMRIFVAVGKGVADWRAMGQQGLVDGLHRNGIVEPNPKLMPYEGWA
jgi:hypothetical protein